MGKMVSPPFLGCFWSSPFYTCRKEDIHKILDKFEFWPDRSSDYGVSCPWASKKFPIDLKWEIGVLMLTRSFFIKSSGKLLLTRTGIKAQLSSILGRIRPLILELLALEWRKFHTFELEYLWSKLANLDQILCVASLGWGKGCIRFWGRLTLVHLTLVSDHCPLGYLLLYVRCKFGVTFIRRSFRDDQDDEIYFSISHSNVIHREICVKRFLRNYCA